YFYEDPWAFSHPFRLYVTVDFGAGAVTKDYAWAEILDYNAGAHRESEEITHRLIELERGDYWQIKRLRGGRPDTGRFWE
ncbi:hypothetical protein IIA79_04680, partial [bacterium]|nr:hypothetical protein [bacterium]